MVRVETLLHVEECESELRILGRNLREVQQLLVGCLPGVSHCADRLEVPQRTRVAGPRLAQGRDLQLGVARDQVEGQAILIENVELSIASVHHAEQVLAVRMDGADVHSAEDRRGPACRLKCLGHSQLDCVGCLLGEGECDDRSRICALVKQPCNPVRERA